MRYLLSVIVVFSSLFISSLPAWSIVDLDKQDINQVCKTLGGCSENFRKYLTEMLSFPGYKYRVLAVEENRMFNEPAWQMSKEHLWAIQGCSDYANGNQCVVIIDTRRIVNKKFENKFKSFETQLSAESTDQTIAGKYDLSYSSNYSSSSSSNLYNVKDINICMNATTKTGYWNSEIGAKPYLNEAKKRNLTLRKCSSLTGRESEWLKASIDFAEQNASVPDANNDNTLGQEESICHYGNCYSYSDCSSMSVNARAYLTRSGQGLIVDEFESKCEKNIQEDLIKVLSDTNANEVISSTFTNSGNQIINYDSKFICKALNVIDCRNNSDFVNVLEYYKYSNFSSKLLILKINESKKSTNNYIYYYDNIKLMPGISVTRDHDWNKRSLLWQCNNNKEKDEKCVIAIKGNTIIDSFVLNQLKSAKLEQKRLEKLEEEKILAEQKRLEEEKRLAEQALDIKRLEEEKKLAEEKRLKEERRLAEQKRLAEELLAETKRLEEEKRLAEEKRLKQEKRLKEEKRLAEQKRLEILAEQKRLAEEKKLAEEKRLKEERLLNEEELKKKLALFGVNTELENAQEFIQEVKDFVKSNQNTFDIIEIAELIILTSPIVNDTWDSEQVNNLKLLNEYTNKSNKFLEFQALNLKLKNQKNIKIVDNEINLLNKNINFLKTFLRNNLTSNINLVPLVVSEIKSAQLILDKLDSLSELKRINLSIEKLTNEIELSEQSKLVESNIDSILIDEDASTNEKEILVETKSMNALDNQSNDLVWGETGYIIFDDQEMNFTDFMSKSSQDIISEDITIYGYLYGVNEKRSYKLVDFRFDTSMYEGEYSSQNYIKSTKPIVELTLTWKTMKDHSYNSGFDNLRENTRTLLFNGSDNKDFFKITGTVKQRSASETTAYADERNLFVLVKTIDVIAKK